VVDCSDERGDGRTEGRTDVSLLQYSHTLFSQLPRGDQLEVLVRARIDRGRAPYRKRQGRLHPLEFAMEGLIRVRSPCCYRTKSNGFCLCLRICLEPLLDFVLIAPFSLLQQVERILFAHANAAPAPGFSLISHPSWSDTNGSMRVRPELSLDRDRYRRFHVLRDTVLLHLDGSMRVRPELSLLLPLAREIATGTQGSTSFATPVLLLMDSPVVPSEWST
jgi:hypothetical protein